MVVTARGLAGGVALRTVGDALVAGLGADEVGHCLRVLGSVGADAIAANAGVVEGNLECISEDQEGIWARETYGIAGVY